MRVSKGIEIEKSPHRLEDAYAEIFTQAALNFLREMHRKFDDEVEKLIRRRDERRLCIRQGKWKPEFKNSSSEELDWKIDDLPVKLRTRKLDIGDVSPANTTNFADSLYAKVQGIQVDFDDGHCPTWRNTVQGLCNVTRAVHSCLPGAPTDIRECPVLMLRPRAFNMIEHHCIIDGKEVAGPLFDYALLVYHNAKMMADLEIGPYFYLSKIEGPNETQLWNKIFTWTEHRLGIRNGTIKACVLIENILASYRMEDILFSIKEHAIGLNCGVWDYSASIIAKFGDNREFLIPDRNKYVNTEQLFLKNYMRLLIHICHKRGALATGGMAAKVLPYGKNTNSLVDEITKGVEKMKLKEIEAGVDGFLVYDLRIVDAMNDLWRKICPADNQLNVLPDIDGLTATSLITIPVGGVTIEGLNNNINVALLFIYHWFTGSGVFYLNGAVEDSATAEISRSQIWQWVRHRAPIEGKEDTFVTRSLVYAMMDSIIARAYKSWCISIPDRKRLLSSKFILLEIVSSRCHIEFITTYLNDNHKFRTLHNKNDKLESKL
ncbi:malate synthase-like [Toxorhynchites rutilus septentrionalis]|uniref:malate synthase-like n=1 Tax=Toxorhynchites rutilus septentrionalis TaxID=329112 RepID=UPI002479F924|nr:malate synthase-like [Toxorhynchites rutilus septentrionalis]